MKRERELTLTSKECCHSHKRDRKAKLHAFQNPLKKHPNLINIRFEDMSILIAESSSILIEAKNEWLFYLLFLFFNIFIILF